MQKGLLIFVCVCLLFGLGLGCGEFGGVFENDANNSSLLRIHVRANSNSRVDQTVKFEIKNELVDYLTPKIVEAKTVEQAKVIVNNSLGEMEQICNEVLLKNGFSYCATCKLANEYFPDRIYEGIVVEKGFYDALIVELGQGLGDNWWCVVYPPLCFVNATQNGSNKIVYKSKLWEIIKEFFDE